MSVVGIDTSKNATSLCLLRSIRPLQVEFHIYTNKRQQDNLNLSELPITFVSKDGGDTVKLASITMHNAGSNNQTLDDADFANMAKKINNFDHIFMEGELQGSVIEGVNQSRSHNAHLSRFRRQLTDALSVYENTDANEEDEKETASAVRIQLISPGTARSSLRAVEKTKTKTTSTSIGNQSGDQSGDQGGDTPPRARRDTQSSTQSSIQSQTETASNADNSNSRRKSSRARKPSAVVRFNREREAEQMVERRKRRSKSKSASQRRWSHKQVWDTYNLPKEFHENMLNSPHAFEDVVDSLAVAVHGYMVRFGLEPTKKLQSPLQFLASRGGGDSNVGEWTKTTRSVRAQKDRREKTLKLVESWDNIWRTERDRANDNKQEKEEAVRKVITLFLEEKDVLQYLSEIVGFSFVRLQNTVSDLTIILPQMGINLKNEKEAIKNYIKAFNKEGDINRLRPFAREQMRLSIMAYSDFLEMLDPTRVGLSAAFSLIQKNKGISKKAGLTFLRHARVMKNLLVPLQGKDHYKRVTDLLRIQRRVQDQFLESLDMTPRITQPPEEEMLEDEMQPDDMQPESEPATGRRSARKRTQTYKVRSAASDASSRRMAAQSLLDSRVTPYGLTIDESAEGIPNVVFEKYAQGMLGFMCWLELATRYTNLPLPVKYSNNMFYAENIQQVRAYMADIDKNFDTNEDPDAFPVTGVTKYLENRCLDVCFLVPSTPDKREYSRVWFVRQRKENSNTGTLQMLVFPLGATLSHYYDKLVQITGLRYRIFNYVKGEIQMLRLPRVFAFPSSNAHSDDILKRNWVEFFKKRDLEMPNRYYMTPYWRRGGSAQYWTIAYLFGPIAHAFSRSLVDKEYIRHIVFLPKEDYLFHHYVKETMSKSLGLGSNLVYDVLKKFGRLFSANNVDTISQVSYLCNLTYKGCPLKYVSSVAMLVDLIFVDRETTRRFWSDYALSNEAWYDINDKIYQQPVRNPEFEKERSLGLLRNVGEGRANEKSDGWFKLVERL